MAWKEREKVWKKTRKTEEKNTANPHELSSYTIHVQPNKLTLPDNDIEMAEVDLNMQSFKFGSSKVEIPYNQPAHKGHS